MTIGDLRQRQAREDGTARVGDRPRRLGDFPCPIGTGPEKGHQYQVNIAAVDQNGNRVDR